MPAEATEAGADAWSGRRFRVSAVARRLEPATEDTFIADLEPARAGDSRPAAAGRRPDRDGDGRGAPSRRRAAPGRGGPGAGSRA